VRSNLNNPEHASRFNKRHHQPEILPPFARFQRAKGQHSSTGDCAKFVRENYSTARTFPLIEFAAVGLAKRGSYRRAKRSPHTGGRLFNRGSRRLLGVSVQQIVQNIAGGA
jgi:hypothetical protein